MTCQVKDYSMPKQKSNSRQRTVNWLNSNVVNNTQSNVKKHVEGCHSEVVGKKSSTFNGKENHLKDVLKNMYEEMDYLNR